MSDKFKEWELKYKEIKEKEELEIALIENRSAEILQILSTFKQDEGEYLVTYKQLSEMPFNEWFDLGDGVKFMRIKHPEKEVYYTTEMTPKDSPKDIAVFGMQAHDCHEDCEVIEGHLIEVLDRNKEYIKGKTVYYPPYFKHKPASRIESVFGVHFYK